MSINATNNPEDKYGVHDWVDKRGNRGTEIHSQHCVESHTIWTDGLFDTDHRKASVRITDFVNKNDNAERKLFVVVSSHLSESKQALVEAYFTWCKKEKLLHDYKVVPLTVHQNNHTVEKVSEVVMAAKKFGLKRRDVFVAIGDTPVTEVVGFAAAIYRRSTPWILIPTDLLAIMHYSACDMRVSIDHRSHDEAMHRSVFTLGHPPIAGLYDPSFLEVLGEEDVRRSIAEMTGKSMDMGGRLFPCSETDSKEMVVENSAYPMTAAGLLSCVSIERLRKLLASIDICYPAGSFFEGEPESAAKKNGEEARFKTGSAGIEIALTSAFSFLKQNLSSGGLKFLLDLLENAKLPHRTETLELDEMWENITNAVHKDIGGWKSTCPLEIEYSGCTCMTDMPEAKLLAALSSLCKSLLGVLRRLETVSGCMKPPNMVNAQYNKIRKHTATENIRYHVATIPSIFSPENVTLIEDYCVAGASRHKKKILVIVDDQIGIVVNNIKEYFTNQRSAIDDFRVVSISVHSKAKDMNSVLEIADVAVEMDITQEDLLIVVGGGTLMDIVGFCAAILRGGIPYIRIPTTLVGMIDAGVGIKVGVDIGLHKSLIGRYHAPAACLNDPNTFLASLPRREFACGLAESIKLAIVRSPYLFAMIEQHYRNAEPNAYNPELIDISIRVMLEELQPNLHELDLRRLVDFGHEFGHIVESLAAYEIPHGECVAVGLCISSFLAHLKGLLSRADLERILNCILDIGLPIYLTEHDCCCPDTLWAKVGTDVVQQKDGKLWLAVPTSIGQGGFLSDIADINSELINKAVLGLKQYADGYKTGNSSSEVDLTNHSRSRGTTGSTTSVDKASLLANATLLKISNKCTPDLSVSLERNTDLSSLTATIIGASGDIGSQSARYLTQKGVKVTCSVRAASLKSFEKRMHQGGPVMRVLVGDLLDLNNLRTIIQETEILYNMAGVVTLNARPEDVARMITVNGFAQGIITYLIRQMGRDQCVQVVYPSSQRVHLTASDESVDAWIQLAAREFQRHQEAFVAQHNVSQMLEQFAEDFLSSYPLPTGFNVYEISKRLGEHFVSLLPRHICVRISGVYGPSFTRGFIYRAVNPKSGGNTETSEVRDFIYIEDLNELLWKAVQTLGDGSYFFDGASGESLDLKEIWGLARDFLGDDATVIFEEAETREAVSLDTTFARHLLGRAFMPMRLGLRKTIDGVACSLPQPKSVVFFQHPETFEAIEVVGEFPGSTLLNLSYRDNAFHVNYGLSAISEIVEHSLNQWFDRLSMSHQDMLKECILLSKTLPVRLRLDLEMTQIGGFTIEHDSKHGHQAYIDIHAGLAIRGSEASNAEKVFEVIGFAGYHLLAFLIRGQQPSFSQEQQDEEQVMATRWKDFLQPWSRPFVIAVDVGATYLRTGVIAPNGLLLDTPNRIASPSRLSYPRDTVFMLQAKLLATIAHQVNAVKVRHNRVSFEEVAISFGGVVTCDGIVKDASILWGEGARDYDLKSALLGVLPGTRVTILNDISAAAWRYKDEERFCLITISSGLSNKIFNSDLRTLNQLELDPPGVGGEMGHVVVEPRYVDALVQYAISQATVRTTEFRGSQLYTYTDGDAQKISSHHLAMSARNQDVFAMRLLEEADVPQCACGNLADLCSYSSGRGVLRWAQRLAARGDHDVMPEDITDEWLKQRIAAGHPLALNVLRQATYPLALRILQLGADVGIDKFIIVGGFALKTGGLTYLQALQDHLMRLCHYSAFYGDWNERKIRDLVRFGIADDNDCLIGMGHFVQHQRMHYSALEKEVGGLAQAIVIRKVPKCGRREILTKVVYSGVCTTDLQILRGERALEPIVLGHESVCQVLEVGKGVKDVAAGEMIVLNPNNPLDDYDKLGHTKEGVFQEYLKFGQESIDRKQVLSLGRSVVSAADTLIEPLSCVVAAQERLKDRIVGKNVLVIGAGVMGLMFVLMNSKMGARNVFLANRSKERLDFAISRGIIQEQKAFVIRKSIESHMNDVSAGEGADVVIICVSLGQGVRVTHDAISCANPAGVVYLFAGFRPGDVLTLDANLKVDVWQIRNDWKTQSIEVAGKCVDLSGHRGSREKDFTIAADTIRNDRLSFNKIVSHFVSLKALPDVMLGLAQDGRVQGELARRVIVDMSAQDKLVESVEEIPYRHLREAAGKQRDAISMGNLFREIGFDGNTPRLGWVYPPSWQDIKNTIITALQKRSLTSKKNFIWVGTGSWGFVISALNEIVPGGPDVRFHVLQSLDPQALTDVFELIENLSDTVCLGTSQSGTTTETVLLMNALRKRFDQAGLDCRDHFLWLTDVCQSPCDFKSGEAVIRSDRGHNWSNVDVLSVTFGSQGDINALFCAPHSTLFFLSLTLLLGKDLEGLQQTYQQYLTLREKDISSILSPGYLAASHHVEHILVELDESIALFMVDLVVQLIEQGLGSKQAGFDPKVRVTCGDRIAGFLPLALSTPIHCPAVVKMMLAMSTLSVYVAVVAYHRRINFVTHPGVNLYKSRTKEVLLAPKVDHQTSEAQSICADIVAHLKNNARIRFVDIICFGHFTVNYRQTIKDCLTVCLRSAAQDVSLDVVLGEQWNHSRYQAAVQSTASLHVVLVCATYRSHVDGISREAIDNNVRTLRAIARATYETLLPKALFFQVDKAFPMEKITKDVAQC